MTLPEPARKLWLAHADAVRKLAAAGETKSRVAIGGGTILGARWQHRLSTDIDVLLPEHEDVLEGHPGGSCDLAKATGGQCEDRWNDRIKVALPEGALDVCAGSPQLPGLEETTVIEGKHETVLASAQVLRGKLNRTNQGLARDAFDLIVASKTEPRALQHAINAISRIETEVVLANLKLTSDDMAGMAAGVLHGIPPEFETDLSLLGYNAAAAAAENRYTRVTITLEPEAARA